MNTKSDAVYNNCCKRFVVSLNISNVIVNAFNKVYYLLSFKIIWCCHYISQGWSIISFYHIFLFFSSFTNICMYTYNSFHFRFSSHLMNVLVYWSNSSPAFFSLILLHHLFLLLSVYLPNELLLLWLLKAPKGNFIVINTSSNKYHPTITSKMKIRIDCTGFGFI